MIQVYCYSGKNKEKHQLKIEDVSTHICEEKKFIWVDIEEATKEDVEIVAKEFNIHNLSLEDALKSFQRPKIEIYDNYLFIVIYGVDYLPEEEKLAFHEVDIFLGANFVITVRNRNPQWHDRGDLPPYPIDIFMNSWDRQHIELKEKGSPMVLHTIADTLVDSYFNVNDNLEDRLDKIENYVFELEKNKEVMEDIYRFKKDLLLYRRVVAPLKDVIHTIISRDMQISGQQLFDLMAVRYFQDVYDHIIRVHEAIDTYRDLLTSALEVQLSVASNRLNEIMKKLTSIAALVMVPTLIAGIYGMNFKFMPELNYRYGYFIVLGIMAAIAGWIAYLFRKYKWL